MQWSNAINNSKRIEREKKNPRTPKQNGNSHWFLDILSMKFILIGIVPWACNTSHVIRLAPFIAEIKWFMTLPTACITLNQFFQWISKIASTFECTLVFFSFDLCIWYTASAQCYSLFVTYVAFFYISLCAQIVWQAWVSVVMIYLYIFTVFVPDVARQHVIDSAYYYISGLPWLELQMRGKCAMEWKWNFVYEKKHINDKLSSIRNKLSLSLSLPAPQ